MLIEQIELTGFTPLLHNNIGSLVVTFNRPVQIVIGENGSGKSSLYRELSPFPAVRTSYETKGSKRLKLNHSGHTFELVSDFSNRTGAHSFNCDSVELNESGTTGVQRDLVETELGWTSDIERLVFHRARVCRMTKAERRDWLVSMYPSDLGFVLDSHRDVLRKLRDVRANIQMLSTNRASLQARRMSDDDYDRLQTEQEEIDGLLKHIERLATRTAHQLQLLADNTIPSPSTTNWEFIEHELKAQHQFILSMFVTRPELFTNNGFASSASVIEYRRRALHDRRSAASREAEYEANRLREFEMLAGTDTDSAVIELTGRIEGLHKTLDDLVIKEDVPVVAVNELAQIERVKSLLQTMLASGNEAVYWPSYAVEQGERKLARLRAQHATLEERIASAEEELAIVDQQIADYTGAGPNAKCSLPCQLKDDFAKTIAELMARATIHRENIATATAQAAILSRRESRLESALLTQYPTLSILRNLEHLLSSVQWGDYITNHLSINVAISRSISASLNRTQILIEQTKCVALRRELSRDLNDAQQQLETLVRTNRPARELLDRTIADCQTKLTNLSAVLDRCDQEEARLIEDAGVVDRLNTAWHRSKQLSDTAIGLGNSQYYDGVVSAYTELNTGLAQLRSDLLSRLGKIENGLNDQHQIRIQLEETLDPMLREAEAECRRLSVIEPFLSPNGGIPHRYLVDYVNYLIQQINRLVAQVWSYELVINPIDVAGELDFNFTVTMNQTGLIPEMSLLSDGQQEIVDLAWTLAIGGMRDVFQTYPLFLDEPDKSLTSGGRTRVLTLLSGLMERGELNQLFLINHSTTLYSAFANAEVLCLNPTSIMLPAAFNEHAVLT